MRYEINLPMEPPTTVEELYDWLTEELRKLAGQAQAPEHPVMIIEETRSVPKSINGAIVFADGTGWNPGAGAGFYGFHSGAWNKLG